MTYIPEKLRSEVLERAKRRCEYYRLHKDHSFYTHEIDHIYAEKHSGETVAANLCLACSDCNRHKGSNLCSLDPQDGAVVALFHPRRDEWESHFRLSEFGVIIPKSSTGRVTERVLNFNRIDLVAERAGLIVLGAYKISK